MFFGMPARIINKEGKAIQGIIGFVGALLKIIKFTQPTHMVALFDCEQINDRTNICPDYKANRVDYSDVSDNKNPFSQLDDIYRALDFLKIKHTEVKNYEVDDIIASYSIKNHDNMEIIISSFDSDFFQLINDNVKVLRYRGDKTIFCDKYYIKNKFDISPNQYADFKSLVGDKCDNIEGLEKIGEKTASKLLNLFCDLGDMITNLNKIEKLTIRDVITKNIEKLKANLFIIKLTDKAPIPFKINELEYNKSNLKTMDVLSALGIK